MPKIYDWQRKGPIHRKKLRNNGYEAPASIRFDKSTKFDEIPNMNIEEPGKHFYVVKTIEDFFDFYDLKNFSKSKKIIERRLTS